MKYGSFYVRCHPSRINLIERHEPKLEELNGDEQETKDDINESNSSNNPVVDSESDSEYEDISARNNVRDYMISILIG